MNKRAMQWEQIHVPEMDCSEEFKLIQKRFATVPGVANVQADYLERLVRVQYDTALITPASLLSQIKSLGFQGFPAGAATVEPTAAVRGWKDWAVVAGGLSLIIGAIGYFVAAPSTWTVAFTTLATVLAAAPVAAAAARSLRGRRIDMNVLMLIAAVGALAIGERFEAATAMFLFGVAAWLEERSFDKARVAVRSLVELVPEVAHRYPSGATPNQTLDDLRADTVEDVHPDQLQVDDIFLVRPGERIPVDGDVLSGESAVIEAHITGESLPVEKTVGSSVFAGAQNGDASLIVQATATTKESATTKLASLVSQARLRQSPTERFVDRFAHWYTPTVIGFASLIGVVWPLALMATGADITDVQFEDWLHRGLILLVIACPCALVVSTPITLVCGLHRATRLGVLIKGGDIIEKMASLVAFAFDKTGTLTTGIFEVVEIQSLRPEAFSQNDILSCAASLEMHSEHPLAQAIVTAARRATVPIENATDVEFQRGRGVTGRWKSHEVVIGNVQLMTDRDMDISAATSHLDPNRAGMGLVYVAIDGAVVGSVLLADQPRGDAEHCIRELRNRGATVTMLTGDRQTVASDVARQLGIDDVRSGLLPQDKLTELSALQEHGPVGVVGDGLNDAPALVQADVGFAMGRRASDLALDSADVVVLSPQLSRIPQAVLLAKATRRALWQNIGLAIGIKAIVLLVTAAGYGSMWLAVAADVGASLIVVANGMTLLRYDPPACCEEHARADPHEHGAGCHHPLDGHVESPTDDTCEQPI